MQTLENIDGYKVIHNTLDISDKEKEEIKQDILLKLCYLLSNDKDVIDLKVKKYL